MWTYSPQNRSARPLVLWLNPFHWSNSPNRITYPVSPAFYWHYSPLRDSAFPHSNPNIVHANVSTHVGMDKHPAKVNFQHSDQKEKESDANFQIALRSWRENYHPTNSEAPKCNNSHIRKKTVVVYPELPIRNHVRLDMAELAGRVHSTTGLRLLIVLDIQGSILLRLSRGEIGIKYWQEEMRKNNFGFDRDMQYIWLRPHFREFFRLLTRRHATALWCSCVDKNVVPVIRHISRIVQLPGTPSLVDRMEFMWGRSKTDKDSRYARQNHQRIKDLDCIWEKYQDDYEYTKRNTLLIDDTSAKFDHRNDSVVIIPYYNCMKRFHPSQPVDDTLMWLILYIEYLTMVAESKTDPIDISAVTSESLDFEIFCTYGKLAADPLLSQSQVMSARSTARALIEAYAPEEYIVDEKKYLKRLRKNESVMVNEDGSIMIEYERN